MTIRAAAAALCLLVALVGCGADPEPDPLPPIASPSPSPAALPMPSEAAAETPQGAAAFARYYFKILNSAFAMGDASPVRQLSHPECDGCNNLVGAIEEELAPGERIEGGIFSVVFAEAPPVEQGDVVVEIRYSLTELRVLNDEGRVLRTTPADPAIDAQLRLLREGQGWRVRGFRNVHQ